MAGFLLSNAFYMQLMRACDPLPIPLITLVWFWFESETQVSDESHTHTHTHSLASHIEPIPMEVYVLISYQLLILTAIFEHVPHKRFGLK